MKNLTLYFKKASEASPVLDHRQYSMSGYGTHFPLQK